MKTWKPTLEVLEGRALLSGFWDPGPGGGTPLPTGPLGVPILAGKGGTDNINFETPGGAVQSGSEVIFLTQDHWDRGGFEDLDDTGLPGAELVDLTPDDQPDPPAPGGGGGGGGGILGWLGNLFGGGKDNDKKESSQSTDSFFTELSQTSQGAIAPPEFDVPNPNPIGDEEKLVGPVSQPTTVDDFFSLLNEDDGGGTLLTPGPVNNSFLQVVKSSDRPAMWGATWTPEYLFNGQHAQYGRATGGYASDSTSYRVSIDLGPYGYVDSAISIEFAGAGVVDPRNRDTVYLRGVAGTQLPVSVPDGGTMVMGGVKALGSATVDKNENITVHG